MQCEGIFDVPPSQRSEETWTVNFDLPDEWNVGLIVGPSGSGKTTVARELFGDSMVSSWEWPQDKSILDGFPANMGIKEIVELLSSVGFSSPPSWVRPFHVLSNGEQFRVNMARTLAESPQLAVVDEFTSVVDRTVAQIGSAAIAKTVRRRGQKFIAVSCHYDITEWLEPDWIYQPHLNEFVSGRSLRRPAIELTIQRVHSSAWQLFRKHHYLDTNLNSASRCYVAFWQGIPVAFAAILAHFGVAEVWRGHRTVTLPDYQGVGIGNALSGYMGALCKGVGKRLVSTTSHPAMIRSRAASEKWKMTKTPSTNSSNSRLAKKINYKGADRRYVASFEYVGPALDRDEARRVWNGIGVTPELVESALVAA
jgi:ABC-type arginine transport system ATPase subunit/GNAT superfamily N-acetyltransferase